MSLAIVVLASYACPTLRAYSIGLGLWRNTSLIRKDQTFSLVSIIGHALRLQHVYVQVMLRRYGFS